MERVETKALEHQEPAAASAPQRQPTVVVRPSSGWSAINIRELWSYRDLLLILAGRDVKLRYKQTALGVAWVILQPLTAALIFAIIFGRFAKLPSDGVPYILFVFCGLLAWNLFAGILQRAGNSLIGDARLISKVYFPRLLIPLASTGAVLVDFVVALVVLAVLMPIYHVGLSWQVLALPGFLALTVLGAAGIALWVSALNVQYRDFMYALPFIIQVWLFATPVAYAGKLIPPAYRWAYSLNPAVGYVEGFRWALLGRSTLSVSMTLITAAVTVVAFVSGAFFFRRIERGFADAI
jgi:lipopolysaccharide transport system permease protein